MKLPQSLLRVSSLTVWVCISSVASFQIALPCHTATTSQFQHSATTTTKSTRHHKVTSLDWLDTTIDQPEQEQEQQQEDVITSLSVAGRWYQLECQEQGDSLLSEIYLREDGTVLVGQSEGPKFENAWGQWEQDSHTGGFAMKIGLQFQGGYDHHNELYSHRIGQFAYEVERTYVGELTMIGSKLGTEGTILDVDEILGEAKVGYFTMIDTTEEMLKLRA